MGSKKSGDSHEVCGKDPGATCHPGYFLLVVVSLLMLTVATTGVNWLCLTAFSLLDGMIFGSCCVLHAFI